MILAISLALYFCIHSWLASNRIKTIAGRYAIISENYRLWYSVVSVVLLVIPAYVYATSSEYILFDTGIIGRLIFLTFAVLAYKLFVLSFRRVRLSEFLGIRKSSGSQLIVSGIYAHIRHPLYLAVIIFLLGLFIAIPSDKNLILLVMTCLYIQIGALLEEGRLDEAFGGAYKAYKQQTPMLLPREPERFIRFIIRNR